MLVVLRLALGFHFLYEGVWKISRPEFSAEPFLSQAKGPAAPLFYAMLPDLDGRQRLRIETDDKGKLVIKGQAYLSAWKDLMDQVVQKYRLTAEQQKKAKTEYERYEVSMRNFFEANLDDIKAHFESLDRFEESVAAGNNGAAHQQERTWDRRQELRKEAGKWLKALDSLGEDYRSALWWKVLDAQQRKLGELPEPLLTQKNFLNYSVKFALAAIGLCLIIGFCTRLAALGGGVFMMFVLATQPPWPTIYPPAPEVVGHALIVDKNFVEMVALLLVASTHVGRWGGLDFFLYQWFGRPIEAYLSKRV